MQDADSKVKRLDVAHISGYTLRATGRVLQIICLLLFISIGVGREVVVDALFLLFGRDGGLVLIISSLVVFPLAIYLNRIGKRLTSIRGVDSLPKDHINPVLYLRSFIADREAAKLNWGTDRPTSWWSGLNPFGMGSLVFNNYSEEEALANELSRIGPCIAVGIPGEKLPRIGMARTYFNDNEWEKGVRDLMERSELVVMRAGVTENLKLELEMAVKHVDPKQLIILLPFDTEQSHSSRRDEGTKYEEFRDAANKVLPKELPPFSGNRMPDSKLSGVIYFQSDWTPKTLRFSEIGNTTKESLESITRRYVSHGTI